MRRAALIPLLALLALLIGGCGSGGDYSAVRSAVEHNNSQSRYKASFVTELTLEGGTVTLLFMQGSYSADRDKEILHSSCVEVYMGTSSTLVEMYSDGYVYTEHNGEKIKYRSEPQDIFGYMHFARPISFNASDINRLSVSSNASGNLYRYTVKGDYRQQLLDIIGDGIYGLARINKPQTDKTGFGEIRVEDTLTEEDGQLVLASRQMTFLMYLYDTPPYTPGYTPPEKDYMLEVTVRIKVSYTERGEGVEISAPVAEDYNELE